MTTDLEQAKTILRAQEIKLSEIDSLKISYKIRQIQGGVLWLK